MKRKVTSISTVLTVICTCIISELANAHAAIDCFETTPLKGGNAANSIEGSDLDLLLNTSLNHVITTVKVCTNRQATQIIGIQVSYGRLDQESGDLVDAVTMHAFGNTNDSTGKCQVKYIEEGDHVKKVFYQYT